MEIKNSMKKKLIACAVAPVVVAAGMAVLPASQANTAEEKIAKFTSSNGAIQFNIPTTIECSGDRQGKIPMAATFNGKPSPDFKWKVNTYEVGTEVTVDEKGVETPSNLLLPLGKHTISVQLGEFIEEMEVEVVDTKGPEIKAKFLDLKGNVLEKVTRKDSKKVVIQYEASDVCDPDDVHVYADTFGHIVESGDRIRMKGRHHAIVANVQAYDQNRNFTNLSVFLPIEP